MRYYLILTFLLLSLTLQAAPIVRIELQNRSSVPSEQIRQILTFKEGDPFEEGALKVSEDFFRKWGRFREISLTTQKTRPGVVVTVSLQEGWIVKDVHISGNYPFLSRTLHRRISIRPGDFFDEKFAKEQMAKLEGFYEREGYFDTKVSLDIKKDEEKGQVTLYYRILKGKRYRLGKIGVEGTSIFPRGYFISAVNPLLSYRPAAIRQALEEVRRDYHKKGYLQARIRLADVVRDDPLRKVHFNLEIREGPKTILALRGNRRVASKNLKKVIPVLTDHDPSLTGIEESIRAIRRYYKDRGFQNTIVSAKKRPLPSTGQGPGEVLIQFEIQEGSRSLVKKVEILGNQELSDRKIKKGLSTRENRIFKPGYLRPETVEEDRQRIPEIYASHGFYKVPAADSSVRLSRFEDQAEIRFSVEENGGTQVGEILFEGNRHFPAKKLRDLLKMEKGNFITEERVLQDLKSLESFYHDEGYLYAVAKPVWAKEPGPVILTYQIDEGPSVTVGEILIVGNRRTRAPSIKRALPLKEGRPFTLKKMLKGESGLRRMGVFRSVEIEPLGYHEKRDRIHLLVRLEENPVTFIDLEATYDTDDKFTGGTSLQLNNLFGYAKRGALKLTGGQDVQKGEISFTDPRLLGVGLELTTSGLVESEQRPGFDATDVGGKFSLLREFSPRMALLGKYRLTRTFFQGVNNSDEATERDHTNSTIGASLSYDGRDQFADPHQGFTSLVGLDLSNKLIASGINFLRPVVSFAHFESPVPRVTFYNYLRIEGIQIFGTDILTRDLRLFLGGDYSIRGFDQDGVGPRDSDGSPAGGQLLLLYTFEGQVKIKGNLKFAAFLDSGSLTNNFSQVGLDSWRHSAGGGLRYVTPIGPLRLDYGVKLDKQAGESRSRLHFAFGFAF